MIKGLMCAYSGWEMPFLSVKSFNGSPKWLPGRVIANRGPLSLVIQLEGEQTCRSCKGSRTKGRQCRVGY